MSRLDNGEIGEIAAGIYRRCFGDEVIESVSGADFVDWTGEEAIRVDIMIKPGTVGHLKGGALGDAALALQDALTAAGEERFAHSSFGEVGEVFETEDERNGAEETGFEDDDVRTRP